MRTACFSYSEGGGGGPHYRDPLNRDPLDRDPLGRNMGPGTQTESDIIQRPLPCGQIETCKNFTLS